MLIKIISTVPDKGKEIEDSAARFRGLIVYYEFAPALDIILRDGFFIELSLRPRRDHLFVQDAMLGLN